MGQPEALLFNMGGSLRGEWLEIGPDTWPADFSQIAVLLAWEFTFRELGYPISRRFRTPFLVGPRITVGSLSGGPGVAFGCLMGTSWILEGVLGILVRLFWVPLARMGCLWSPSGASLRTQGCTGGL